MVTVDWDSLSKALEYFEKPILIQEGQIAIIEGDKYIYKKGEWILQEPQDDE